MASSLQTAMPIFLFDCSWELTVAEVLVEFDTTVSGRDGTRWLPRVCGRVADDGLWEGWIEFLPIRDSAEPVRTPRETEQSNRNALMYWAQGLTQVYLESALLRALEPPPRRRSSSTTVTRPYFDSPAPRFAPDPEPGLPVLNPFEVYEQGENVLWRQLSALSRARLLDIVTRYGLPNAAAAHDSSRETLVATIMSAVRRPAGNRGSADSPRP
jgi:hypothetical protein